MALLDDEEEEEDEKEEETSKQPLGDRPLNEITNQ